MPKNILMIGSTGVGKTEIARRLAKLTNSPFLKVEASKFTEVGYVGRDVESIVRDLMEIAIDMVREEKLDDVEDRAELLAEERLIELLIAQGAANSRTRRCAANQPPAHRQHADARQGRHPRPPPSPSLPRPTPTVCANASACCNNSAKASSTTAWSSSRRASVPSRRSKSSATRPRTWSRAASRR